MKRTVQDWMVRRHWLQAKTKCLWGLQQSCNSCASLAGLVFMFYCMFYFTCDRSLKVRSWNLKLASCKLRHLQLAANHKIHIAVQHHCYRLINIFGFTKHYLYTIAYIWLHVYSGAYLGGLAHIPLWVWKKSVLIFSVKNIMLKFEHFWKCIPEMKPPFIFQFTTSVFSVMQNCSCSIYYFCSVN